MNFVLKKINFLDESLKSKSILKYETNIEYSPIYDLNKKDTKVKPYFTLLKLFLEIKNKSKKNVKLESTKGIFDKEKKYYEKEQKEQKEKKEEKKKIEKFEEKDEKNEESKFVKEEINVCLNEDKKKTKDHSTFLSLKKKDKFNEYKKIIKRKRKLEDNYTILILKYLDSEFNLFRNEEDIENYLKSFKLSIIDEFVKKNIYSKYNYSIKDFKKSDADELLVNNRIIPRKMTKIFGDVLDLNLVFINKGETEFITSFLQERVTIVIIEEDDQYETIIKNDNQYFRGSELFSKLKISFNVYELEKENLCYIQNLARMYNLNIKKEGKIKYVNKLKAELIQEIMEIMDKMD